MVKELLLSTGDEEIYEDNPTDFIWGHRNQGLNLLGKALMEIREVLKNN
ncbi:MAG: NADAR family protein [Candidatus Heimdallarchaeota archaeon]|nr:NADAR family protein [Candidatus Heimdallarchaeota archaeon]